MKHPYCSGHAFLRMHRLGNRSMTDPGEADLARAEAAMGTLLEGLGLSAHLYTVEPGEGCGWSSWNASPGPVGSVWSCGRVPSCWTRFAATRMPAQPCSRNGVRIWMTANTTNAIRLHATLRDGLMPDTQAPTDFRPPAFSAGVVVARLDNGGWRLLAHRAHSNWDSPKGTVEPGEAPLDAAIRETVEEAASARPIAAARWRATTWLKPRSSSLPCRCRRKSGAPSTTNGAG